MAVDWTKAQRKAAQTARWAVTMTKVRIRQALARTRWQLVTFCGVAGGESVGIVDLMAIRKDHGKPLPGTKRGDALQMILIQVKGGRAAMPTAEDKQRLRAVARRYHARVLLATWTKGKAARFFRPRQRHAVGLWDWIEVEDLNSILPALNRCESCGKAELGHKADHPYKRDARIPEWHGWHAARRGLGSNLYRLGVPDMVIQRILRHANVSTTATYYIKTAADDVRTAMARLEGSIRDVVKSPEIVTKSSRTESLEPALLASVN